MLQYKQCDYGLDIDGGKIAAYHFLTFSIQNVLKLDLSSKPSRTATTPLISDYIGALPCAVVARSLAIILKREGALIVPELQAERLFGKRKRPNHPSRRRPARYAGLFVDAFATAGIPSADGLYWR